MNSIKTTIAIVLVLVITGSAALAAGGAWVTDFEAAKVSAKAAGKYLLVNFTSSDRSGPCAKLKGEVFSKAQFKTEAPRNFILVELDFPKSGKPAPKLTDQNARLRDKYKVHRYPTILLMDADGKVFARSGYRAGGPKKYIEHLNSLVAGKRAFDKLLVQAAKSKGLEKAKLLDKALSDVPDLVRVSRPDLVRQICELDEDDMGALKSKYEFLATMDNLAAIRLPRTRRPEKIKEFGAKWLVKIAEIEKRSPVTGRARQKLLSQKAMFTFYSGDLPGAKKIFEEAIAIDAESELADGMKRSLAYVIKHLPARKPKSK